MNADAPPVKPSANLRKALPAVALPASALEPISSEVRECGWKAPLALQQQGFQVQLRQSCGNNRRYCALVIAVPNSSVVSTLLNEFLELHLCRVDDFVKHAADKLFNSHGAILDFLE
jgi:hypothetical protein